ncbi:DoxX family protein [Serinicoccus kebangsaanensis]|uniref:DoxX family protein n=1 Tax=Serinicoccus kebangsaanensis TaxID=2602069 RepID=UPI00124EFEED|nr:DoxX family protein [Serinicoccus kebangsaanensis]
MSESVDGQDASDFHREVDDPWDEGFAVTGPVEAHGRSLDFGLLLLRLGPLLLIPYGVHAAADMPAFVAQVDQTYLGSQAPDFIGWLIMLAAVALPVLLLVGLFTRPAAFLLTAVLAVVWTLGVFLRAGYRPVTADGGLTGESALLLIALVLPLTFTGAGRLSVDSLRTGGRP